MQLFFAMHDVTPFHQQRLERAEALFAEWGITKVLYLLIPNYHGAYPADQDITFRQWCRRPRPFAVEWFLHGYYHLRSDFDRGNDQMESNGLRSRDIRTLPVGSPKSDESEFNQLSYASLRERVDRGREIFCRTLEHKPTGFVPPKWVSSHLLLKELNRLQFEWTEDQHWLRDLSRGLVFRSPVITWATRSWWRKQTSLWGCPLLSLLGSQFPLLRIAVHPFDFDHPQIITSIARIVRRSLEGRQQAFYHELRAGMPNSVAA